jgi:hypothetical protein
MATNIFQYLSKPKLQVCKAMGRRKMGRMSKYTMDYIRKNSCNHSKVCKASYNKIGLFSMNNYNHHRICYYDSYYPNIHPRKAAHLYDMIYSVQRIEPFQLEAELLLPSLRYNKHHHYCQLARQVE